jgi:hypothetical protein
MSKVSQQAFNTFDKLKWDTLNIGPSTADIMNYWCISYSFLETDKKKK